MKFLVLLNDTFQKTCATMKSLINEHASLGFWDFFSTILTNFYPARLSNSINEFVLPARLFHNQDQSFKKIPTYSFILVCPFMSFQKNASLLVYSGLLVY